MQSHHRQPHLAIPQRLQRLGLDSCYFGMFDHKSGAGFSFKGFQNGVLRDALDSGDVYAAVSDFVGDAEHADYCVRVNGELGPAGEDIAGAINLGFAGLDVEAREAFVEPFGRNSIGLWTFNKQGG